MIDEDMLIFYRRKVFGGWRWRYLARGNYGNLANGSESYRNLHDAQISAFRVCGLTDADRDVTDSSVYLRPDSTKVHVVIRD